MDQAISLSVDFIGTGFAVLGREAEARGISGSWRSDLV